MTQTHEDPRVPSSNAEIDYDESNNPAIAYPDSWTIPAGDAHTAETVEQAHPRLFYTQQPQPKPVTSDLWRAGYLQFDPQNGQATAPMLLLGPNTTRKRVVIVTGAKDTGVTFIGPDRSISNTVASGFPATGALVNSTSGIELTTTGAVYVTCLNGACTVSFIEESFPA